LGGQLALVETDQYVYLVFRFIVNEKTKIMKFSVFFIKQ